MRTKEPGTASDRGVRRTFREIADAANLRTPGTFKWLRAARALLTGEKSDA